MNKIIKYLIDNINIVFFILIFLILLYFYNYYINKMLQKIIIFDMDETLGCFFQLGAFIDGLEKFYNKSLSQKEFDEVFDLYPEYIRPDMINILNFLVEQRNKGNVDKIVIFTNNQGPKSWAQKISKYFSNKIQSNVFDKIIGAWKVSNRINEPLRTSHEKKLDDIVNILNINKDSQICFIDDLYHANMDKGNTFYINITPYYIVLPTNVLIQRYIDKYSYRQLIQRNFYNFINNFMSNYKFRSSNFNTQYLKQNIKISDELFNDLLNYLDLVTPVNVFQKKTKKFTRKKNSI